MDITHFEELYDKVIKIAEVVERFPANMQNEVCRMLLDAAKESGIDADFYKNEVLKLCGGKQALEEFVNSIGPESNIERSVTFTYFLEKHDLKTITAKHISACYELMGFKEPGNLSQNLRDACNPRYRYLDYKNNGFVTTDHGKEFCSTVE